MKKLHNHSPWIFQLKRSRKINKLLHDAETNICIVGGGIAGITTAYFLLKHTKLSVTLIEAGRIAHGSTGHNAGQVVAYFERPFSDIVKEFGLKKAGEGQRALYLGWDLLHEIIDDACLETPIAIFTGYAGLSSAEQILLHLENKYLRKKAGISIEEVYISDEFDIRTIPRKYRGLYTILSHEDILARLETNDTRFHALLATKKGCMNSALFTEELAGYLLKTYSSRFRLYEKSPIQEALLFEQKAILRSSRKTIIANRVILCTNGFENITIHNMIGKNINKKFHELVHGLIGFMAGYVEHKSKTPTAISYFTHKSARKDERYFYFTRRYFELEKKQHHTLICAGGPDMHFPDKAKYMKNRNYKPSAYTSLDSFLTHTYNQYPCNGAHYRFKWHGLMGYTKTGLRVVGAEPRNPVLLYNLGCNGVGILSSIYGSKRISDIMLGKKLKPSIFDPRE